MTTDERPDMNLRDGATYVDGMATRHTIGGPCRDYPDWCWSIGGDWFDRRTGRHIAYIVTPPWPNTPRSGHHEVGAPSWRDLWKEVDR